MSQRVMVIAARAATLGNGPRRGDPMTFRFGPLLSIAIILGGFSSPLASADKAHWQAGRLLAADLSGHGLNPRGQPTVKRSDVWWVYCISAGGKGYSVVSRESPPRAGLTIGGPVKFLEERDRLQILNSRGKRLVMRVVRRGSESICRTSSAGP